MPDPHEVEPHLDQPKPLTLIDRLAQVLKRSDADLSATETMKLEVDRHASLSTLMDEYDVLAREAQVEPLGDPARHRTVPRERGR